MGYKFSPWILSTLDVSVDDDLTPEIDLQGNYEFLTVLLPSLDSGTVTVHIAKETGGTFFPIHTFDADATGSFAHASSATTGEIALTFRIGGVQFVKVSFGTGQSADESIYVRGFN